METFKDIPGYEGLYQISDLGRVLSVKRGKFMKTRYRFSGRLNGRIHLPYEEVNLSKDGKFKTRVIHRLVLLTFKGPCPMGHIAMHQNDNPKDNRLINLKWGTPSENTTDAIKKGRQKINVDFLKKIGPNNGMQKKVIMMDLNGNIIKEFESVREAGRITGLHSNSISYVCIGKQNSTGGYKFKHSI